MTEWAIIYVNVIRLHIIQQMQKVTWRTRYLYSDEKLLNFFTSTWYARNVCGLCIRLPAECQKAEKFENSKNSVYLHKFIWIPDNIRVLTISI